LGKWLLSSEQDSNIHGNNALVRLKGNGEQDLEERLHLAHFMRSFCALSVNAWPSFISTPHTLLSRKARGKFSTYRSLL
jgi:hypothetical protein